MSWYKRDIEIPPEVYAKTLDECAEELGISKQAVQQLEISALRKIRQSGLMVEWLGYVVRERGMDQ